MKVEGIIDKIYDNSATNDKGVFISNFAIDLVDGKRLYCRELLNPMPSSGAKIGYNVINQKTSSNGNPYVNVEKLVVLTEDGQQVPASSPQQAPSRKPDTSKDKLIFVTGVVGRAMGGGNFSEEKIDIITQKAVESFNKHFG